MRVNYNELDDNAVKNIISILLKNPQLKHLSINNSQITEQGAKLLLNTSLTHLDISNNEMGRNRVKAVFAALPKNFSLQYIGIDNQNSNDLFESIQKNDRDLGSYINKCNDKS